MAFYFAWVDKTDRVFSPEYAREDEKIFGFRVLQNEGDFASLDIELINPEIGLLAPTRKQWAWLSWDHPVDGLTPLFFGRLIGVPEEMVGRVVKLSFISRPIDFEEQKELLAEEMRVAPWYDPAWLSEEDRKDPDRVLEGYTKLWHVDRVTGALTASDIINGEDGTVVFNSPFYDSVSASYSESPARRVIVEATVNWTQRGRGAIDVTRPLLEKFAEGNIEGLKGIDGERISSNGIVAVVAGDQLIENWPKQGTAFGGGWSVGRSSATLIGDPPTAPIIVGGMSAFDVVRGWKMNPAAQLRAVLRTIFARSPGIPVQIVDHNDRSLLGSPYVLGHAEMEILWVPVWRVAPKLELNWEAARPRTETVTFELEADVQPLLTDPGESETVRLTIGPADVDAFIGDRRRPRYFSTEHGKQSLQNLMARARAILYNRARAVEVAFDVPFSEATKLTCRKNGYIADKRLPGGSAAGKIKAYSFEVDGNKGAMFGSVVLGCTVGRDGSVDEDPGHPDYCVEDYTGAEYQAYIDVVSLPLGSSVGYTLDESYPIDDDGVSMFNVQRFEYLEGIEIDGTLDTQQQEITKFPRAASAAEVIDRATAFTTTVTVRMKPIRNTAFVTQVQPIMSVLKVPRTIDLEEALT